MPLPYENRHRDLNRLSSGRRGRQQLVGSLNFESPLHQPSLLTSSDCYCESLQKALQSLRYEF